MDYIEYIEKNTTRCEATHRGGGIEIDCNNGVFDNEYMVDMRLSAYQNYLGGGMLGRVQSCCNFDTDILSKSDYVKYSSLKDTLKEYYHGLTNHSDDEYESASYYQNQQRAVSACL